MSDYISREPKEHWIKIELEFANAVLSGEKPFEVRLNDRGYQKGDLVRFNVIRHGLSVAHDLTTKTYVITYVLNGWGIKEDYVVFGIREVSE